MSISTWMLVIFLPVLWPFIAKLFLKFQYTKIELLINIVAVCITSTICLAIGSYSQVSDTEIWNGKILSKSRIHDHYVHTYECDCTETCSGSGSKRSCTRTCRTCYEDRYTVTWSAKSTIGNIQFDHLDEDNSYVYDEPDPKAYKDCYEGQPASLSKRWVNYLQAAPESLFGMFDTENDIYEDNIPEYPKVRNYYQVDRVLNVGTDVDVTHLDALLDEKLILLGEAKQVNIIVILTNILDPNYRFSVENHWVGANKNDVIVFIGLHENTINWVDVMTWARNSGNEVFQVQLRDALLALKTYDAVKIANQIEYWIVNKYDRPQAADYEYLKDHISPPIWALILIVILNLALSIGITIYNHKTKTYHRNYFQ